MKTNDAGESTSISVDETLQQRGNRYGAFKHHAEVSQQLLETIADHMNEHNETAWNDLPPFIREALTLICHKLGRIANGDPYYDDNYRDIAGYAKLVDDILNNKNT